LKYQPIFDLQLSSFTKDSKRTSIEVTTDSLVIDRIEKGALSSAEKEEGVTQDEEDEERDHSEDDNRLMFLDTVVLPQENNDDDIDANQEEEEEILNDFSDTDSILEPLDDDDFHRSNEFSSSVMVLSRIIFKMTSDHIYSFYENQLLTNLACPFLHAIQKIKILFDSNEQNLKSIQTSELCSEVRNIMYACIHSRTHLCS
jgi:hypothetical protein